MTLKTRKPTGAVPWPLVLVEGPEKTGKSFGGAVLSASKRVGRTVVIDLSEGAWDEYGKVPGARFEIAEHDGTFASVYAAVMDARAEAEADAKAGKPPFVLIVDPMTALWDLLKDWAGSRAKGSRANRAKLERDPNAEITIPMNLWNDANTRHRRLMTALMTFPGIVVVTARGGWVAAVEGGQPVEGKKSYRVEGNKNLGYDVSAWVRLSRDEKPILVGARSVHAGVRPGIDPVKVLPDDWTLEWLVFDALKCDPAKAHVRDLVQMRPDAVTPEQIRDEALNAATSFARIKELYAEASRLGYDDVTVSNERGQEELLLPLLKRTGDARQAGKRQSAPEGNPADAGSEAAWTEAFNARLAAVTDALGTEARAFEVNKALGERLISPAVASGLHAAIAKRRKELREAGPAEKPATPARDAAQDQPATAEDGGETEWVRDFLARLADADDETAIRNLRIQVGKAVAARTITPATANELGADVKARADQIREKVPA